MERGGDFVGVSERDCLSVCEGLDTAWVAEHRWFKFRELDLF